MQSIATGSAKLLRQTVSDRAPFSAHSRLEETGRPTPPPAEGRYFSLTLERPPLASTEKLLSRHPAPPHSH